MTTEKGGRGKIEWGKLVHQALEHVHKTDDLDEAIVRMKYAGLITASESKTLKEKLNEVIQIPEVKPWFDESWEVLAEHEILLPDGNSYRPDRVIIKQGQAIVIDYKTGEPRTADQRQVFWFRR